MVKLHERLRQLRNEKGETLIDAAKGLDVSKNTLSRYERGERKPDHTFIERAADYYSVTTDYLLGRTDIRHDINTKIKQAIEDDPELYHFWEQLSTRDELKLLFKQTKDLDKEGIKSIVQFIKAVESRERK